MACHEGGIVTFAQSETKISLLKPNKNAKEEVESLKDLDTYEDL